MATSSQNAASRANAAANIPMPKDEQVRLRKIREKARKRGTRALNVVVSYWIAALVNPNVPRSSRDRAAENIANRFGLPALQAIQNIGDAFDAPKLFDVLYTGTEGGDINGGANPAIAPPPNFTRTPVIAAVPETNGHTNGSEAA